MRKIVYLAAAALLCASCFRVNSNYNPIRINGKNTVKGEGNVVSKSFDLKDFDAIEINGQASDAVFTQSSEYEVTLRTHENLIDIMNYHVEGTTLVIETKDKQGFRAEEFDLMIKAPTLKRLEVNGATDFDIPGGLVSEGDLKVEINGAGDLELKQIRCASLEVNVNGAADLDVSDIDVQKLDIQVNGAGDVVLSGKAGNASFEVNGAGDIDARNLSVAGEVKKRKAGVASIKL